MDGGDFVSCSPSGTPLLGFKVSWPLLGFKLLGGLETWDDGPSTKGLTTVTHSMPTPSNMILEVKDHEEEDNCCAIAA